MLATQEISSSIRVRPHSFFIPCCSGLFSESNAWCLSKLFAKKGKNWCWAVKIGIQNQCMICSSKRCSRYKKAESTKTHWFMQLCLQNSLRWWWTVWSFVMVRSSPIQNTEDNTSAGKVYIPREIGRFPVHHLLFCFLCFLVHCIPAPEEKNSNKR